MDALELIDAWPVENAAVGVASAEGVLARRGPAERGFQWASVTKLATAVAVLVAAEEGIVELDEPAGPPGSTVRHLLAHASGLPLDGDRPVSPPGERRIYSNTGFEVAAALVAERAEMPFEEYLRGAVLEPLGMGSARLEGSPAWGLSGSLDDLLALGRELLAPRFLAEETVAEATAVAFPGLVGRRFRGSGARIRTTGGSASSCATASRRTGRARATRRGRSGTSAGPARSSGSIPRQGSRAPASPTGTSATGRVTPGPRSPTPCSAPPSP